MVTIIMTIFTKRITTNRIGIKNIHTIDTNIITMGIHHDTTIANIITITIGIDILLSIDMVGTTVNMAIIMVNMVTIMERSDLSLRGSVISDVRINKAVTNVRLSRC